MATNETPKLITKAIEGLRKIYVKGYRYQKVGIELKDLKPDNQVQSSFFETSDCAANQKRQKLLKIIDKLNGEHGKDSIRYAAMGYERKWKMKQQFLSRKYTTKLEDVILVKAI